MNQIFNSSRFIKYSKFQLCSNKKLNLLSIGGVAATILLILVFILSTKNVVNANVWAGIYYPSFIIASLITFGNAFPWFRTKNTTISTLMTPASTFEKVTFEYLYRLILILLIFTVGFYTISNLAVGIVKILYPHKVIDLFSFQRIISDIDSKSAMHVSFFIYLFLTTWFFAGSASFVKHPMKKTIAFTGGVTLLMIGYFFSITKLFFLKRNMSFVIGDTMSFNSIDVTLGWVSVFYAISAVIALTYTYFKLKEKEV